MEEKEVEESMCWYILELGLVMKATKLKGREVAEGEWEVGFQLKKKKRNGEEVNSESALGGRREEMQKRKEAMYALGLEGICEKEKQVS